MYIYAVAAQGFATKKRRNAHKKKKKIHVWLNKVKFNILIERNPMQLKLSFSYGIGSILSKSTQVVSILKVVLIRSKIVFFS